jgi:adenylate kinase
MIVVVGLPGAGKTSVLNELKKVNTVQIVNFGDLISEIAIKKGLVKSRDEINNLPVKIHKKLQKETVKRINALGKRDLIIDTHAILKKRDGFLPGISPELLKEIDALIFIDAPSKEIVERRKRDISRKREILTVEELDEHRSLCLSYLASYSSQACAPLFIIENREGKLRECVEKMLDIFDYIR